MVLHTEQACLVVQICLHQKVLSTVARLGHFLQPSNAPTEGASLLGIKNDAQTSSNAHLPAANTGLGERALANKRSPTTEYCTSSSVSLLKKQSRHMRYPLSHKTAYASKPALPLDPTWGRCLSVQKIERNATSNITPVCPQFLLSPSCPSTKTQGTLGSVTP